MLKVSPESCWQHLILKSRLAERGRCRDPQSPNCLTSEVYSYRPGQPASTHLAFLFELWLPCSCEECHMAHGVLWNCPQDVAERCLALLRHLRVGSRGNTAAEAFRGNNFSMFLPWMNWRFAFTFYREPPGPEPRIGPLEQSQSQRRKQFHCGWTFRTTGFSQIRQVASMRSGNRRFTCRPVEHV